MNWLKAHSNAMAHLALAAALAALVLSVARHSPGEMDVLLNALQAFSTVLVVYVAIRALSTWKTQEARSLAVSLWAHMHRLTEITRDACEVGHKVACFGESIVAGTSAFAPGLKEFLVDESRSKISRALTEVLTAKSEWEARAKVATASWGDAVFDRAQRTFTRSIDESIEGLRLVRSLTDELIPVLKGLGSQPGDKYEDAARVLEKLPDKLSEASCKLAECLKGRLQL